MLRSSSRVTCDVLHESLTARSSCGSGGLVRLEMLPAAPLRLTISLPILSPVLSRAKSTCTLFVCVVFTLLWNPQ